MRSLIIILRNSTAARTPLSGLSRWLVIVFEFMPVVNVLMGKDQSGQLSQGDVAHAA